MPKVTFNKNNISSKKNQQVRTITKFLSILY